MSLVSFSIRLRHASVLTPVAGRRRNSSVLPPAAARAFFPGAGVRKGDPSGLTVNVHGAGAADSLSARATEGQGRVEFVLDLEDRVEDHRPALVHVDLVRLHVRLLGGLVRVLLLSSNTRTWRQRCGALLNVTSPSSLGGSATSHLGVGRVHSSSGDGAPTPSDNYAQSSVHTDSPSGRWRTS